MTPKRKRLHGFKVPYYLLLDKPLARPPLNEARVDKGGKVPKRVNP